MTISTYNTYLPRTSRLSCLPGLTSSRSWTTHPEPTPSFRHSFLHANRGPVPSVALSHQPVHTQSSRVGRSSLAHHSSSPSSPDSGLAILISRQQNVPELFTEASAFLHMQTHLSCHSSLHRPSLLPPRYKLFHVHVCQNFAHHASTSTMLSLLNCTAICRSLCLHQHQSLSSRNCSAAQQALMCHRLGLTLVSQHEAQHGWSHGYECNSHTGQPM